MVFGDYGALIKKTSVFFGTDIDKEQAEEFLEWVSRRVPARVRYQINEVSETDVSREIIREVRGLEMGGMVISIKDPMAFDKFFFVKSEKPHCTFSGLRFDITEDQLYSIPESRLKSLVGLWEEVGKLGEEYGHHLECLRGQHTDKHRR